MLQLQLRPGPPQAAGLATHHPGASNPSRHCTRLGGGALHPTGPGILDLVSHTGPTSRSTVGERPKDAPAAGPPRSPRPPAIPAPKPSGAVPTAPQLDAGRSGPGRSGAPALRTGVAGPPPTSPADPRHDRSRRVGQPRFAVVVAIGAIGVIVLATVAVLGVMRWRQGPSLTAREQRLNKRLLTAQDFPQDWTVVPPSTDLSPTALSCLASVSGTNQNVPVAARGFRSPIGIPNVVQVLESYSTSGAVRRFDQLVSQVFHGCPSKASAATSTGLGQTQLVVMPQVGDESAAVAVPTAGTTTSTVVVARTRGVVVYLVYETHGPPDANLLQLTAIRAVAKASTR